jgi:Ca2+-binding RTX toxin-like protein
MFRAYLQRVYQTRIKPSFRRISAPVGRRRPQRSRLLLEGLEDRLVPTLLFHPAFGSENPTSNPGTALQSPRAYFTYWGSYWNTPAGSQYENTLISTSVELLTSAVLQGEKQYGGDGVAYYGTSWIDSSDPPATFNTSIFSIQFNDVQANIQGAIDNPASPIPAPSRVATTPVYVVVLPPTLDLAGTVGWNRIGTYTSGGSQTPIHMVLLRPFANDAKGYSLSLSREFEESIANDVTVTRPKGLPLNLGSNPYNPNQICENEPAGNYTSGVYSYQLATGAWAQAYWSHQDGQYILPEGNAQSLQLAGVWSVNLQAHTADFTGQYDLTINGSQGLAANDTVTIGFAGNSLSVTLDGENWQFANDPFSSITIGNLHGNATVNIEGTDGTPVFVNLGAGTDTVNITPTSQNLDNLMFGNVQVNGGTGFDTLNINDQANGSNSAYTMTESPFFWTLFRDNVDLIDYINVGAVNVNGGQGAETYVVQNTEDSATTTINTGGGGNTVNVLGTLGALNVVGGSNDTVNIGNNSSVQAIFGDVHISNPQAFTALNVDDSADMTGHAVTITNASITGLAPAGIFYAQSDLFSLNIQAGSGASTFNVQSTPNNPDVDPLPTYLSSGGTDIVNVGNAGSVQGIQGTLTIENPPAHDTIIIDDSADTTPRTTTLDTFTPPGDTGFGSVTGLAPGTINYEYADTSSVTIATGNVAGNVVNVLATGATTNLFGNAATTVNVGNNGSVQGIFGAVHVINPPSFTALNVDDSADTIGRPVTITNASITGLAPGVISYAQSDLFPLNIQAGSGGSTFTVQSTPNNPGHNPVPTTLSSRGADTVTVGNAGSAQGILGSLTIQNPLAQDTIIIDDSADLMGQSANLAASSLTGLTPGPINFTPSKLKSLTVLAGAGDDSFTVSAAPTFSTSVDLGGGNNTLTGPNATNIWMITSANHGTLGNLTFSNAQNLVGGTGNDTFKFAGVSPAISGTVTGGGGKSTLDYSLYTGGPISVNLATSQSSLVNGGAAGGFSGITSLVGNANAGNTLTAANTTNAWRITGPNAGKVNTFSFSAIGNLVGGTANDTFAFEGGGSLANGGSLTGTIDGGGGTNTLDYSGYSGNVIVDLALHLASLVDQLAANSIFNIQNVIGSMGNDLLVGDANPNVLKGGTGRSIIIGGAGADQITAGAGESILIAGTTAYDQNLFALDTIMAEWLRTDLTFQQRLSLIQSGGDPNEPYLLNSSTVFDDGAADTLTGGAGRDWYFASKKTDILTNFRSGTDHLTPI